MDRFPCFSARPELEESRVDESGKIEVCSICLFTRP